MPVKPLAKSQPAESITDLPRLGLSPKDIKADYKRHFNYTLGRDRHCKSAHYAYTSLALTVRDRLMERWKNTRYTVDESRCKQAYYLSMEFLLGRALGNAMLNLGITDSVTEGLYDLGIYLEELIEIEPDAGLGNGGLGRLAACFLDSCASLQLPVMGYGLRYEYGMFRQLIEDGFQVEEPDHWLRNGNAWELERPELTVRVRFGGRTEKVASDNGRTRVRWVDTHDILAVPFDMPVPGFKNDTVNTLRLWKSTATDEFDLDEFNEGDYPEAVAAKNKAEQISLVLYPNDASENGKELRLRQQYFLASASLQDVLRRWVWTRGHNFSKFAEQNCFQLNDTHPSIAVAELMRLLMDEHGLEWDEAWNITSRTMAYTNHTLLPEALEKWPVRLFEQLLPRILEIIYEINARFLAEVDQRWPGDMDRLARMSLIEEGGEKQVRMAYLAIVGSFSVNGVAALHSKLLREGLFHDFYDLWPHKFNNKTNGITPRRWLAWSNPGLSELITDTIGEGWVTDTTQLQQLAPLAGDSQFQQRWQKIRQHNKQRLIDFVAEETGVVLPANFMLDVQVKRIHEYKRQLLNALHVIHLYDRIKRGDIENWTPRAVIIGGKAAPGYQMAKKIIKLINNIAQVVNSDSATEGLLRLVFLPNYRVSAMEVICAGTDLSEQISTAGKEASGTGNMKFMMNGALTIGTLDGANIEILEEVGKDHFFLFGLTAEQVEQTRQNYHPDTLINNDEDFRRVMELLKNGHFNRFEPGIFDDVIGSIESPFDPWMTAADFRSYIEAQKKAAAMYRDQPRWVQSSILNTAMSGRFSSDRTIAEYNRDIWKLTPQG